MGVACGIACGVLGPGLLVAGAAATTGYSEYRVPRMAGHTGVAELIVHVRAAGSQRAEGRTGPTLRPSYPDFRVVRTGPCEA